ncbi:hypothetical protein ACFQ2B_05405 [Streptomyces stramineus]
MITCFGTLGAGARAAAPSRGRLYTLLFAADRASLTALDGRIARELGRVPGIEETA